MSENYDDRSTAPDSDEQPPRPVNPRFQRGSLRLFSVAGIDVFVHWSWLAVAIIRIQTLPQTYTTPIWNVLEYLSVFAIVLLHEFGHVLACRQVGGIANKIVLWPLGGVALVAPPPWPGAFLWCLAAGPLVNVILVAPTVGLVILGHFAGLGDTLPDLQQFLIALAIINGGLLIFNLLPLYPLDGGQILQAILWFFVGRAVSLMVVSIIGFVVGLAGLIAALVFQFWWVGIMALFVVLTSMMGFRNARALLALARSARRRDLACPSCGQAPPIGDCWRCSSCNGAFDIFEWGAECPDCGTVYARPTCVMCGKHNPYDDWFPEVLLAEHPAEE